MIARARALVGHRLRVYRLNEQMTGNTTRQVRTVVHLADHGPDTDPIHGNSAKENVLAVVTAHYWLRRRRAARLRSAVRPRGPVPGRDRIARFAHRSARTSPVWPA
ncbi:hypothetical protein E2C00_00075 [Streptomyces sp. WAC05374]|uniref:hypothetical protein n=1 Tax=Streptomyces sp. WAC05374 TaxID=2487420 RepID=UPI000F884EBF|nr:hypothetical protein [Streptomyces sp. WAC05374]RST19668.1 hypothetical protein EF905_00875 [Streptomyces sp. WAC05374]TDF49995.1 hypothetical protein E2B92_00050 [Streptomyces sp. WAC05374]TDF57721.1 hypothetical protein E2C02_07840 [Streptomyces sp. WAC05374]TDF60249.1 hypothetical protein E2C00_00075 [Streptomyces sp. WAC05374]